MFVCRPAWRPGRKKDGKLTSPASVVSEIWTGDAGKKAPSSVFQGSNCREHCKLFRCRGSGRD